MTTHNLELVAHPVLICVVEAVAVAIIELHGILTISCVGGLCVVVAGRVVLTTHNLELVTHRILVCVVQAVAVAIVEFYRKLAVCGVSGIRVVVAGHCILTTRNFQLVAHTVSIGVAQAHVIAVVELLSVHTCAVVLRRHGTEVASHCIGATNEVTHAIPICILHAIALAIE